MAEGETANEDSDTCEDGIEEVEGVHGAHTDEVEERPFHSQVSEWLVQALKDSVRAMLLWFVWHKRSIPLLVADNSLVVELRRANA